MKIRLLGAELFHADGRMDGRADTKKLIVAFRNFANTPEMCRKIYVTLYDQSVLLIFKLLDAIRNFM
jgi:hypothetical protein